MMKNVNLTGLYLDLIAKCDVTGFNLSSMRKIDSLEPRDIMVDFYCRDITKINPEDVKIALDKNVSGEVKTSSITIKNDAIHVYVEFMNNDYNDDYAYDTSITA